MKLSFHLFLLAWMVMGLGCSFSLQSWQLKRADQAAEGRKYGEALDLYSRVVKRAPENSDAIQAARKGSKIAELELKNFAAAAEFYQALVMHAPSSEERMEAQKSLANLYFEKVRNFDQAVIELSRLIPLLRREDKVSYLLMLAKAQYQLNNFDQAFTEIQEVLRAKTISKDEAFEAMIFKTHLLQSSKKLEEAVQSYYQIIKKFPERSRKENVALSLAICMEEKGDYPEAIQVLEDVKKWYQPAEFIDLRISRLKDRMSNMPGAQGLRR